MIDALATDSAARAVIQKIRNAAAAVSGDVAKIEHDIDTARATLAAAQAEPELVFEHGDELARARLRAEELLLEVNARENSPEALKRERLDTERRRAAGQYRNWTLDLSRTDAWAAEHDTTRVALAASVPQRMQPAETWAAAEEERDQARHNQPWKPIHHDEHEWRYGHDPRMPGARTWSAHRQWHWEASDGDTGHLACAEQPTSHTAFTADREPVIDTAAEI